jgi:predicted MFS family arabinose efflux permease
MGMFTVFLFLTYYLEATRGYSAVRTGVAFLPMIAALATSAQIANIVLMPRIGPKILVPIGMALGAIGLGVMAQISLTSHYYDTVLPAILIMGVGMGMIFAPAMQGAITRVAPADAGVASAMVNTMQQVGGSIGTALINTIATTAAAGFATAHIRDGLPQPLLAAQAALHSYTVSFWFSAGIFVVGAILAAIVLPRGTLSAPADGAPAMAH